MLCGIHKMETSEWQSFCKDKNYTAHSTFSLVFIVKVDQIMSDVPLGPAAVFKVLAETTSSLPDLYWTCRAEPPGNRPETSPPESLRWTSGRRRQSLGWRWPETAGPWSARRSSRGRCGWTALRDDNKGLNRQSWGCVCVCVCRRRRQSPAPLVQRILITASKPIFLVR